MLDAKQYVEIFNESAKNHGYDPSDYDFEPGVAVTEYTAIRVRAGLDPHVLGTDVTSQTDVLNEIWNERRLELALEGDRWPDLVRTGRAMDVLGLSPDRAFQQLYPIPARELIVSTGLTQNPGY